MLGVHCASRFVWEQAALGLVHRQKTGVSWETGRGDHPWCGRYKVRARCVTSLVSVELVSAPPVDLV